MTPSVSPKRPWSTRPATRRRSGAAVVVAIAALALGACSSDNSSSGGKSSDTSGLTTVRIAINNTTSSVPVVIADKQGFFKAHGIKAQITRVTDISKIPPALGRTFDIGFSVANMILAAHSHGLPVMMAAADELSTPKNPLMVLVARPDAKISSPRDFAGKKIAAPTLSGNNHLALKAWLRDKAGLSDTDYQAVQVTPPSMLDQLKSGAIDVAEMSQPYAYQALRAGMVDVGNPIPDVVGSPAAMSIWATTKSYASHNLQQIHAFRAALDDAEAYMKEHPDAAFKEISAFTGINLELAKKAPLPQFRTQPKVEYFQQWGNLMKQYKIIGDVDYKSLVAE